GRIGKEFADALADRARSGVRVHLLVDWVGSNRMDPRYLDAMREAGVEIEKYHPPRWYTLHKLNNRTHRKLLVVDGRVGFTGGAESMHLMYLLSTVSAARNIDLAMAYFVPDDLAESALVEALARGVKIRMIMPGPYTDTEVLRKASRGKWGRLLRAGAEIYEY